ncbi:hypothetical protein [Pseudarthrobacter sp. BIM B-2242]|uniref:hypothetical protein n=1 Tax=Pseudarthrobacter sp. BIM B-2242 TaxID=2772401 RepID=UPI00168A6744|nr:hypothetical protein [Pseudarthrobacter sp. BIM B-2242]QOD05924.1 hypothetical protein IDT60_20350 [Pseudarthrobacter sp. BIM B-2242]
MDLKPTAVLVTVDAALLAPAPPEPDTPMLKLIRLERTLGHKVFILTSLPERFRAVLYAWLRRLGLESDGILMRADGEHCPDAQLKTAMAAAVMKRHHVVHAYNDRADSHIAYTRLGLNATRCALPAHSPVQAHAQTES